MPLLLLTVDMVCLQALMVVWVVVFSFSFVVAANTLSARLAAARPILGVGKNLACFFQGCLLQCDWNLFG